jgi:hypothetical protein
MDRDAMADRVIWALIAAVAAVNVILMWRIAIGGI